MRITYLIGNGFDLGLGLHTSYLDFLTRHYLLIKDPEISSSDLLRDVIRKDLDSWSDAELAFAQISDARFLQEFPGSFYSAYDDFTSEMVKYLGQCEECLVDQVDADISYRFKQTLLSIFTGLRPSDKGRVALGGDTAIELNFVNFNHCHPMRQCA